MAASEPSASEYLVVQKAAAPVPLAAVSVWCWGVAGTWRVGWTPVLLFQYCHVEAQFAFRIFSSGGFPVACSHVWAGAAAATCFRCGCSCHELAAAMCLYLQTCSAVSVLMWLCGCMCYLAVCIQTLPECIRLWVVGTEPCLMLGCNMQPGYAPKGHSLSFTACPSIGTVAGHVEGHVQDNQGFRWVSGGFQSWKLGGAYDCCAALLCRPLAGGHKGQAQPRKGQCCVKSVCLCVGC